MISEMLYNFSNALLTLIFVSILIFCMGLVIIFLTWIFHKIISKILKWD